MTLYQIRMNFWHGVIKLRNQPIVHWWAEKRQGVETRSSSYLHIFQDMITPPLSFTIAPFKIVAITKMFIATHDHLHHQHCHHHSWSPAGDPGGEERHQVEDRDQDCCRGETCSEEAIWWWRWWFWWWSGSGWFLIKRTMSKTKADAKDTFAEMFNSLIRSWKNKPKAAAEVIIKLLSTRGASWNVV